MYKTLVQGEFITAMIKLMVSFVTVNLILSISVKTTKYIYAHKYCDISFKLKKKQIVEIIYCNFTNKRFFSIMILHCFAHLYGSINCLFKF